MVITLASFHEFVAENRKIIKYLGDFLLAKEKRRGYFELREIVNGAPFGWGVTVDNVSLVVILILSKEAVNV